MFAYDEAVAERYPTIRAGVIHATGLSNGPIPSELLKEYRAEQRAASERLNVTAIADLSSIRAWRRAFADEPDDNHLDTRKGGRKSWQNPPLW